MNSTRINPAQLRRETLEKMGNYERDANIKLRTCIELLKLRFVNGQDAFKQEIQLHGINQKNARMNSIRTALDLLVSRLDLVLNEENDQFRIEQRIESEVWTLFMKAPKGGRNVPSWTNFVASLRRGEI